jgi:hypothetical protein
MRPILPLASIVFLFTGCTTYQYMTVRGENITHNDRREFVMENDSIRLKYNFSGMDAPINVEVQNKLDKPLYIDWSRSALIINDKAISYVPSSAVISGSVNTTTSSYRSAGSWRSSVTDGSFQGSVAVPREMDFIPPGSYKSKTPLGVTNVFYPAAREGGKRKQVGLLSSYSGTAIIKDYSDTSSPFRFTSYLTLYTEGAMDNPIIFQHSFYVSEIWTTSLAPSNFRFINDKEGDRFYVRTTNGFGKIAGGFGILAGYALITYAEVKTEESNPRHYNKQ